MIARMEKEREAALAYVEELVNHAGLAGQSAFGSSPIPMDTIAYCSGAVSALERVGLLSPEEAETAVARCHAAYGLKPAPSVDGPAFVAYVPEWAEQRPPHPWDTR